jgi:hypothetical protein
MIGSSTFYTIQQFSREGWCKTPPCKTAQKVGACPIKRFICFLKGPCSNNKHYYHYDRVDTFDTDPFECNSRAFQMRARESNITITIGSTHSTQILWVLLAFQLNVKVTQITNTASLEQPNQKKSHPGHCYIKNNIDSNAISIVVSPTPPGSVKQALRREMSIIIRNEHRTRCATILLFNWSALRACLVRVSEKVTRIRMSYRYILPYSTNWAHHTCPYIQDIEGPV